MFKVVGNPKGGELTSAPWMLETDMMLETRMALPECAEVKTPQSDGSPGVGRELSLGRPRREATREGFPKEVTLSHP